MLLHKTSQPVEKKSGNSGRIGLIFTGIGIMAAIGTGCTTRHGRMQAAFDKNLPVVSYLLKNRAFNDGRFVLSDSIMMDAENRVLGMALKDTALAERYIGDPDLGRALEKIGKIFSDTLTQDLIAKNVGSNLMLKRAFMEAPDALVGALESINQIFNKYQQPYTIYQIDGVSTGYRYRDNSAYHFLWEVFNDPKSAQLLARSPAKMIAMTSELVRHVYRGTISTLFVSIANDEVLTDRLLRGELKNTWETYNWLANQAADYSYLLSDIAERRFLTDADMPKYHSIESDLENPQFVRRLLNAPKQLLKEMKKRA
ncbi:MAG: hypothetical protein NTX79_03405 [Candidatus Micrarchaeota archaeon]|nr:hypothetical protein [Candidatus Micrarchaeota archaeon]